MSNNVKREDSDTPADSGRRRVQPPPQHGQAAAAFGNAGQAPQGPHAHPAPQAGMTPQRAAAQGGNGGSGQRLPPMGSFARPQAGPVRGMNNSSQVNSNATQATRTPTHATRTPSGVPHRPGQPITPASGALRVARPFVPTPETSIPQPSIAQIGAARNAVTAANPNLPAGTPAHGRESLVRFIAITNHAVAPVHAMAILMRANWDLNVALNRHMAQQAGESSEDEDSEDEEGEEGDETNLGDPEPDELPVDEYGQHQLGRPRTNFSAPSRGKDAKNEKFPKKNGKTYAHENTEVDRVSARRNHPDESKQTITLTIDGVEKVFKWGKSVSDWDNPEDIERLNRWRQQVFRRWLGPIRHRVVSYHPQENQFLIDRARAYHNAGQNNPAKMNWNAETKAFNDRFAGKTLPGTNDNPRPARSKGSLTTQIHRIPEVGAITGTKIRGNRAPMTSNTTAAAPSAPAASAPGVSRGQSAPAASSAASYKHRMSSDGNGQSPAAKTKKPKSQDDGKKPNDEDSDDEDSYVPDADPKKRGGR